MIDSVLLTGRALDAELVWQIGVEGAGISLDPEALDAVRRNRAALEIAIERGDPIYGVTTGLGALVRERVSFDEAAAMQRDVLRSHAAGVGDPLPPEVVRAAVAAAGEQLILAGFDQSRVLELRLLDD